jgi:UPF0755 protein
MSYKKYTKFLLLAPLILIGVAIYIFTLFKPVSSNEAKVVQFTIPKGQAVSIIANRLEEQGLIKNSLVFRFLLKQRNLENKLQAGSFRLSPTLTPVEIAYQLTQGTDDIWVTILEGWRREEVAESIVGQGFEYFDAKEFLDLTIDYEGQIFPDTYLFSKESTATTIFNVISNNFEKKIILGLEKEISRSNHDFAEVLVMASIVEREAKGLEEMRHVAGILWNRFDINMALQADATLQYAKGYDFQTQSWWVPPLAVDKKLSSLFNTYLHPGLPPRPIANPGLDAIKASLNPSKTDDLYYLHDSTGVIHYGKDLQEHNANIQQYLR